MSETYENWLNANNLLAKNEQMRTYEEGKYYKDQEAYDFYNGVVAVFEAEKEDIKAKWDSPDMPYEWHTMLLFVDADREITLPEREILRQMLKSETLECSTDGNVIVFSATFTIYKGAI